MILVFIKKNNNLLSSSLAGIHYSNIILAHFNKYSGEQSYGLVCTIQF